MSAPRSLTTAFPPALHTLGAAYAEAGFTLRFVGGCVRDWLAGREPKDVDLATDATPEQQIALYEAQGLTYYPTGIDHGTLSVRVGDDIYEITTLRTESDHDGRRATVAFTSDWVADLARRDLTINAMALSFDGELIDPFDGVEDLTSQRVRFVGEPVERVREDYLRILRFFRFHGRFGGRSPFDTASLLACAQEGDGLRQISGERIWSELQRILAHDSGVWMLRHMWATKTILPAIGIECLIDYGRFQCVFSRTHDPVVLTVALVGADWPAVAQRWRWSRAEQRLAAFLVEQGLNTKPSVAGLKFSLVKGVDRAWLQAWCAMADAEAAWVEVADWPIPVLPVNGDDLKAIGYSGRDIGVMLDRARFAWAVDNYQTSRETMLDVLRLNLET